MSQITYPVIYLQDSVFSVDGGLPAIRFGLELQLGDHTNLEVRSEVSTPDSDSMVPSYVWLTLNPKFGEPRRFFHPIQGDLLRDMLNGLNGDAHAFETPGLALGPWYSDPLQFLQEPPLGEKGAWRLGIECRFLLVDKHTGAEVGEVTGLGGLEVQVDDLQVLNGYAPPG